MRVRLGDYIKEYSVKNKNNEDIPVYSVSNSLGFCKDYFGKEVASKNKTTYKIVPRGCFAYNPSRINVGSVDWQNEEERVIVSPLYNVFSVSPLLDQQYLLYYLKSNVTLSRIRAVASGSVRDNLKLSMLYEFPIDLISLDKQYDVVSTLNAVQKIIDLYQKGLSYLDELVRARFVEMFGDENNSKGWEIVNIEDVANVQVGVVIKPSQYYTNQDNGIKAFRSLNIGNGYIKDDDWVYFSKEGNKKNKKSILSTNDVLVVRSGAPGTACVVTSEYAGSNAIDVIIAHPDFQKVDSHYLCTYTNMPHGKSQIIECTGGAAQQHFNVGKYNKLKLMLPPLEYQKQYVKFLEEIDKSRLLSNHSLFLTKSIIF